MTGTLLFDFADPRAVRAWRAIDDRVMGGVSHSRLRHDPAGHAWFEGEVSMAHGGGFASVRSDPGPRGTPQATVCELEVRGGGRGFKLVLRTDDRLDGIGHEARFTPDGDEWQVIALPLSAFRASFRGRAVADAPALVPAQVRQVGLVAAGAPAGRFALQLRRMALR